MDTFFTEIFLPYIFLPLIGILLGVVAAIIAKKNKIVSDKKTIFFFLLTSIALALPALFGLIDYWFMPYAYIILEALYLIGGYYFLNLLEKFIKGIEEKPYYIEFLSVFIVLLISSALFTLIFNLCNELQYGLWACTCTLTFIFPTLFRKTYRSFMAIPLEVYKLWSYEDETQEINADAFDHNKIIVVELELFKQVDDIQPLNIKAKASEDIPFGIWFKVFIDDYNKRSPQSPIASSDYENSYGWIFYASSSILGQKRYIDPELTFAKNKIRDKNVVVAKRTKYEEYATREYTRQEYAAEED